MELLYPAVSWLATYLVHSTILLGGVWFVTRFFARSSESRDLAWKAAAVTSLVTATLAFVALPGPGAFAQLISDRSPARVDAAATADSPSSVVGSVAADRLLAPPSGNPDLLDAAPASAGANARATDVAWTLLPAFVALLLGAWLTVALILLATLVYRRMAFLSRIGKRSTVSEGAMYAQLVRLARRYNRRGMRLTSARGLNSPAVLAADEICVPEGALQRLRDDEQRSLIHHEFAHVLRRDPAWLRFFHVVERVFFFQPLNRLARHEFERAAEERCDNWVVDQTGEADALASCIVRVARWMEGAPAHGFASMAGGPLRSRVERLVSGAGEERPRGAVGPIVLLSSVMLFAAWRPGIEVSPPAIAVPDYATVGLPGLVAGVVADQAEPADTVVVRFTADSRYHFLLDGSAFTYAGSGTVVLDGRGTVSRISRGGRFIVASDEDDFERLVTIRPTSPGSLVYEYEENGASRSFDDSAQRWLRDGIRLFVERWEAIEPSEPARADESLKRERAELDALLEQTLRLRSEMADRVEPLREKELELLLQRQQEVAQSVQNEVRQLHEQLVSEARVRADQQVLQSKRMVEELRDRVQSMDADEARIVESQAKQLVQQKMAEIVDQQRKVELVQRKTYEELVDKLQSPDFKRSLEVDEKRIRALIEDIRSEEVESLHRRIRELEDRIRQLERNQ